MNDIKRDVKSSVKDFTQVSVSKVVKESTKKLIKNLPEKQKRLLEARIIDMSDDQLEQYFADDPYFKDALENTIKSVSAIPPKKGSGFWKKRIESVSKCTSENLATTLSSQVIISIILVVASVALLTMLVISTPNNGIPVANFSSNVTSDYAPLQVQFTDLSQNATGWNWEFGDGTNSTAKNPIHKYSNAGKYTVSLTVKNAKGSNTVTKDIKIIEKPVAAFSAKPTSGKAPLTVDFTDKSTGTPTKWKWNFGDGTSSTQQNPEHQYLQEEKYKVTLTVSNAAGSNTTTKENYIKVVRKPVANFTSNVTIGRIPLSVQFTDFSQNATELNWNFGDGTSSSDQRPVHVYFSAGKYNVNLTATNENGNDSKFATIVALKHPDPDPDPDLKILPVANFSSNLTEGYVPLTVRFTDLSQNATEWNWDFGDGNNSSNQSPAHTYSTAGNYTIFLTAINGKDTNSTRSTITVLNRSLPIANFTSNVSEGYAPLAVQFTDHSQNATGWNWDFEDGTNSSKQSPAHTYFAAGNYNVSLTVSNENGTDSKTATINVSEPVAIPVANFTSNVTIGYAPLPVQFTDLSQNATEWNWNFGDKNTSSEQNPMHVYSSTGIYDVNLTAINANGTNSTSATITVVRCAYYVSNRGSNTVSVIDTTNNTVISTVPVGKAPWGVAVSPGGKMVYVGNNNSNNVSVIDTVTGNVTDSVNVGNNPVGVAVSPDGTKVYVANSYSNTVSVIDTSNNTVTNTVNVGIRPGGVAVSPDGTEVYVTNWFSGSVSIIDAATNTVKDTVNVEKLPEELAISPDEATVYVINGGSDTVSVLDTETDTVTATVKVGNNPYGVAVSPSGKNVYVTNRADNSVSVINATTNTVVATVNVGSWPVGVSVNPEGTSVYVVNYKGGTVSVIDTDTNKVTSTVKVGSNPMVIR